MSPQILIGDPPYHSIALFGPGAQIHHVGLIVPAIEDACPGIEKILDPIQKVWVAFANFDGMTVEFIEPHGADSPVVAMLKKGVKFAHLCFAVADMDAAIACGNEHGMLTIAEPVSAVAFGGRKIAWQYHPVFGLFELVEAA